MAKTAITPTRNDDYPEWYQQVIKAADLAENSDVRGCMVIKPWGWAIWENIQQGLDGMFKATGHENAYFPLFIPLSFLQKEADHVEGFAKECAVVTHHRLVPNAEGILIPDPNSKLEEPLIVRPTSETIIGSTYAKWVQSYRDLPILINQWANVVRWEMRTRLFLRTAEFLWQEGHTAHATAQEAQEETMKMLGVYADFAENWMAMPVIQGEKTAGERFPGAVSTYAIEAMMQDRKALQAGTSHFLGQNFSRAQKIQFQDQNGQVEHAWTTSWGVSTRLVGSLIMTHSDDDGLVLPPRLAPKHIVLLPIYRTEEEKSQVLQYCDELAAELAGKTFGSGKRKTEIIVHIDKRDMRGGDKNWYWVKRGVPLRVEIGPRDIAAGNLMVFRRYLGAKTSVSQQRGDFVHKVSEILEHIQMDMLERARSFRDANTKTIDTLDDFLAFFTPKSKNEDKAEIHGGFALCHFSEGPDLDEFLKKHKVTIRCIPLAGQNETGKCFLTGRESTKRAVFAKSY